MLGKLKKNYFLLITTFLFLYFFFNFLDGERGLISYYEKQKVIDQLFQEKKFLVVQLDLIEKIIFQEKLIYFIFIYLNIFSHNKLIC